MKKTLSIIYFTLIPFFAWCASPQQMKFHCDKDTVKINALLKKGFDSDIHTPNGLVAFYAKQLIDVPYVSGTLEGDTEMLNINIDQLDCTTFIETLYALTRTTLDSKYSWRDYASNLESVRYRNGIIGDYTSRLHYISDWIVTNSHRGLIKEATTEIPGMKYEIKTINYMSAHKDSYPALNDSALFAKMKNFEIGYRLHRFPYIKKEWLNSKETKNALQDGDIIAITTKTDGLDIMHMSVLLKENNKLLMLDASGTAKKVSIRKDDIAEVLRRNRNSTGIRVIRITE